MNHKPTARVGEHNGGDYDMRHQAPTALPDVSGLTRVSDADLLVIKDWLTQRSSNATFFPVDASYLANVTLLMIREVQAARKSKIHPSAEQQNRTGRPGAVRLDSLKVGDCFFHDTNDAMASSVTDRVKALKPEIASVEVYCNCDTAVTTHYPGDWYVFKR